MSQQLPLQGSPLSLTAAHPVPSVCSIGMILATIFVMILEAALSPCELSQQLQYDASSCVQGAHGTHSMRHRFCVTNSTSNRHTLPCRPDAALRLAHSLCIRLLYRRAG